MADKKEYVTLAKDALATADGYFTVYNYSSVTKEYTGSNDEYLINGIGIPAHALAVAPPEYGEGSIAVATNGAWSVVPDNRGKTAFAKDGSGSKVITLPGAIEDGFTLDMPATPYDEWQGDAWVTNADRQKTAQVSDATMSRDGLRAQADAAVVPLQDAVDLDEATDTEIALLTQWKKYRVALNRLDLSTAPDIQWPDKPA